MLVLVESIIDNFCYRVVLVLFSFGHDLCLIWLLGGLTMTDDGGTCHLLLWVSKMVEDVECMGKQSIEIRRTDDHQIKETNDEDGSVKAVS